MLQDYRLIRNYQSLTDSMVDLWHRGYRTDDLRLVMEGYLMALRTENLYQPFEIRRLEEEVTRFLHDPASFEQPELQTEFSRDY
jgi:hypothetical protein